MIKYYCALDKSDFSFDTESWHSLEQCCHPSPFWPQYGQFLGLFIFNLELASCVLVTCCQPCYDVR